GRRPFGSDQQALAAGGAGRDVGDARLFDRERPASGLADGSEDEEVPDRLRHAQAPDLRLGVLPRSRGLLSSLEGADDRRAAAHLDDHEAGALALNQPEPLELVERLVHADDPRAPAERVDDPVGELPGELLGQLEPHRLLAFDAVGLAERRETPIALAPRFEQFRRFDQRSGRAEHVGAAGAAAIENGLRRIGRQGDPGREAGRRGVRREREGGVSGARELHAGRPQLARPIDREREAARLERAGGVARFVLDQEIEPRGRPLRPMAQGDERRAPFAQVDAILEMEERQELAVAPERPGAVGQGGPKAPPLAGIEVVGDEPGGSRGREKRRLVERRDRTRARADEAGRPAFGGDGWGHGGGVSSIRSEFRSENSSSGIGWSAGNRPVENFSSSVVTASIWSRYFSTISELWLSASVSSSSTWRLPRSEIRASSSAARVLSFSAARSDLSRRR